MFIDYGKIVQLYSFEKNKGYYFIIVSFLEIESIDLQ